MLTSGQVCALSGGEQVQASRGTCAAQTAACGRCELARQDAVAAELEAVANWRTSTSSILVSST